MRLRLKDPKNKLWYLEKVISSCKAINQVNKQLILFEHTVPVSAREINVTGDLLCESIKERKNNNNDIKCVVPRVISFSFPVVNSELERKE